MYIYFLAYENMIPWMPISNLGRRTLCPSNSTDITRHIRLSGRAFTMT